MWLRWSALSRLWPSQQSGKWMRWTRCIGSWQSGGCLPLGRVLTPPMHAHPTTPALRSVTIFSPVGKGLIAFGSRPATR